ncbi:MAG: hypothetical protein L3J06_05260 [Cyclobacteriaceae bacterium]|nr:hypothetical protein [Cyclobacteriaceae bacterium]
MKNREEQIDKLFKNSLLNYEEAPASSAWDSIESQLPTTKKHGSYWIAASVIAILMISIIAWNTILNSTNALHYETASSPINPTHPQKEFIPLPVILHSTTVVYLQSLPNNTVASKSIGIDLPTYLAPNLASNIAIAPLSNTYTFDTQISSVGLPKAGTFTGEPVIIIYKKGDPKHPKLAKAANFLKEVGDGNRPLIDFEKITTGIIARRESINNSNN